MLTVSQRESTFIEIHVPLSNELLDGIYDIDLSDEQILNDNSMDERIFTVKKYVDDNPPGRHEISELAEKAGLSSRYFSIKFKKIFGLTPKQYQIKSRMNYALRMLQNGKMQCSEISEQLQFPDQFTFSKQFKRTFGMAPSQIIIKKSE